MFIDRLFKTVVKCRGELLFELTLLLELLLEEEFNALIALWCIGEELFGVVTETFSELELNALCKEKLDVSIGEVLFIRDMIVLSPLFWIVLW